MSEPFSLADAEATFGPEDSEHVHREVAAAPKLSPEQIEHLRALFASVRLSRPADSAAEAA